MSRKLMFRAWDEILKFMSDPFTLQDLNEARANGYSPEHEESTYCIEQFTGLYDNKRTKEWPKGQPIYEGDTIKHKRNDSFSAYNIGEVVYDENRVSFLVRYFKKIQKGGFLEMLSENGDIITDTTKTYMYGELVGWKLTVIGNRHENPHLLTNPEKE